MKERIIILISAIIERNIQNIEQIPPLSLGMFIIALASSAVC
jgi:hypothetical protein